MRTRIFTWLVMLLALGSLTSTAQTACPDLNGYVESKNVAGTGFYTLQTGIEEKAAQTYHYNGIGKVSKVRVYGTSASALVPLRISIYSVDANGRPTATLQSVDRIWYWLNNPAGYIDVSFGLGVTVNGNFAVGVSILGALPNSFGVKYTGNGEGLGEDLASLAGTSTGGNWASAANTFSKDGDFYLVPDMTNFINPGFTVSNQCIATGGSVAFTNTTEMTKDSMFNIIGWSKYTGSNFYYTWDFGDGSAVSHQLNPSHTYATAGVYTVTLTSKIEGWHGVCSSTATSTISVGLGASTTNVVNVLCNGNKTGALTAVGAGGSTPYTYSINGISYASGATFSNLAAGTYTVYVKDAVGCISSTSTTITQNSPLVFATPQTTNAGCGNQDGQILVSATGGNGTLKYRLNQGTFVNSGLFKNLSAGAYQITVRDAVGCTQSTTVVVSNQTAPVLSVLNSTNISCSGGNDGSITLIATGGGTGTLQYSINGGTSFQTGTSFTGLTAGTYGVLVKDATGCSSGTTVVLTQPAPISIIVTTTPVVCFGGSSGVINVNSAIGGIGTFSYTIDGTTYQSSPNFSGLVSGNYTVIAKDVAGCTKSAAVTVTQPAVLSGTATASNPTCNGSTDGGLVIAGAGGAGSYSYSLNGSEYQFSGSFLNLGAGTYRAWVKDKNNCTYSFNATVTEPTPVDALVQTTNSTCSNNNGALLVTGSGGSGSGYQYSLDGITFSQSGLFGNKPSGTYYIVVKDGAGCLKIVSGTISDSNGPTITGISHTNVSCNGNEDGTIVVQSVTGGTGILQYGLNGSNFQSSGTFTGLQAGTYVVVVKDANGCAGEVTQVITQPAPITVSGTVVDVTCYGANSGRVTITAIGGAGTLAYSVGGAFQSSNVFNNLSSNTYPLVVRDAAGCLGVNWATVTQPSEISINTSVLNVTCANAQNGVVTILAEGGTGTLQYALNGFTFQSGKTFSGLAGASYTVYVRDNNQCVKSKVVVVQEPAALAIEAAVSDVTCAGGNNGFVNLSISGGVSPYAFQWSNGSKSEDVFNLSAGNYNVTVTDANGCTSVQSDTIVQPAMPIIINGTVTPNTGGNGAVDITVTGGTEPYLFSWSNGEKSEDIQSLNSGTYTVEVTDTKGCASSNVFTVPNLTGIDDVNELAKNLTVYPNPASQFVNVKLDGAEIQKLKVVDVLGQVVYETENQSSSVRINTSTFNSGAYYIQAIVGGNKITKHLQIVR